MDIAPFISTMHALGREPGVTLTQIAPGVPEYHVAMGPFPARIRVGFDVDPKRGLVPEVMLDVVVAEVTDRWAVIGAWSAAPSAAAAEHGLPHRLPAPDLTFPSGPRRTVEIAYRAPLADFDVAAALSLMHVAAAYACFMARDLAPHLNASAAADLATHGIAPGVPVPFPAELLARECDHGAVAWAAA